MSGDLAAYGLVSFSPPASTVEFREKNEPTDPRPSIYFVKPH